MSVVSGKFGTLHIGASEIIEVTKWKFTKKTAVHSYASNSTAGYKKSVPGTRSGTVSFEGKYDPADPIDDHIDDGTQATAKLYTTASKFYTVPLTVESVEFNVDLDEGEIVSWSAEAVTNGAWTDPVGAA